MTRLCFAVLLESRSCPRVSQRRFHSPWYTLIVALLRRGTYPFQTVILFSRCNIGLVFRSSPLRGTPEKRSSQGVGIERAVFIANKRKLFQFLCFAQSVGAAILQNVYFRLPKKILPGGRHQERQICTPEILKFLQTVISPQSTTDNFFAKHKHGQNKIYPLRG